MGSGLNINIDVSSTLGSAPFVEPQLSKALKKADVGRAPQRGLTPMWRVIALRVAEMRKNRTYPASVTTPHRF